jgi:predicted CXXCH cytochrome family protein
MVKATRNHLLFAVAGVFALAAVGCVSEDSTPTDVVRDASFVGYSNPDTKQTTCGNCHVDVQAEWAQTKHASAWADLQASGHASEMCNKCHTTNGTTNVAQDSSGFFSVSADAQRFYQDVQCESCHGPGANHILAPGETQPVQLILANDTTLKNGCASCHNGTHNPFSEQLAASKHGEMPNWEGAAGSCQVNCHSGYGAIAIYNPRFTYVGQLPATTLSATTPGITCSVCHDPHDATNPAQTRLTVNEADSSAHLCGKCHNRGPVAISNSSWKSSRGGHSAQYATLMGYAGYLFTNTTRGPARHGSIEGTCATCHMNAGPVNTAAGAFAVQNTGHTFMPAPCLDPTRLTTGGVDVTESCAESARDFSACATGGCHGSNEAAEHAMEALQTEIKSYIAVLWVDNQNGCVSTGVPAGCVGSLNAIDSFDTGGWLPRLLKREPRFAAGSKRLSTTGADTVFTVAKAARFNVLTFGNPTRHGDGSYGVHNPAFVRSMFRQSISQVWAAYGAIDTLPPAPAAVRALLSAPVR